MNQFHNDTSHALLQAAIPRFPDQSCAERDAEILLLSVLNQSRAWLRTNGDELLQKDDLKNIREVFLRRINGEPVAYILGEWEFYSLTFKVTPATLVPRPETELLVDRVLELIKANSWVQRVVDLGTGSGAIAVALKSQEPNLNVSAVEYSKDALSVAEYNATANDCDIDFYHGSWLEPLKGMAFDIIMSNPPYVADHDPHLAEGDLPFEPRSALVAQDDGLSDIKHILEKSLNHLNKKGVVIIEHGYEQGPAVQAVFNALGYVDVKTHKDYAGLDRFTEGSAFVKSI